MTKVLIVDDSVFSQKIAANLIKKYMGDVELSFANDGEEGIELYEKLKPDFVITDLLMPKLSGQELIRRIKAHDKFAEIIVISADVQKNIREEVEAYNILSFLNKPLQDEKAQLICNLMREKIHG
ncbi:MAG: response regulator [Anaerocolumna aminovalerica]|jgi:two-component system chemotaxis response regulator CheY|uniref:response regulator transcription factor n=1 Tax=Anaerocolumna aminovalerica TaxID=1527 RepID=UPI00248D219A|nr:response regulator [Anaerocolumna aminovalerica]MDU6266609.1 response regulator [Anaerocolumna aminovalerica]